MTPVHDASTLPAPAISVRPSIARSCAWLALGVLLAALLALGVGPLAIAPLDVLASLGVPVGAAPQDFEVTAVTQIRLPRLVLALLVGASLAQAGAAMQGIFRNPLAEPGIAGLSSGAALAAVAVIVLGAPIGLLNVIPERLVLPIATFCGGAGAAWLVARLAQVQGYTRIATLLLAGLAINAIANAGIGFFSHIADDMALRSVMFWMFGSLGKAGWGDIAIGAPLLLIPLVLLPREARALNALLLGEAEARHLGVDVEALKRRIALLIVLAVGGAVALAGIVAFVGLIVPHLVRLWGGPDHRFVLPASALLGALLLTLADTLARLLLAPAELPIGILTALVGGPFFLALLLRYRASAETL